jgi:hypothetical protein
MHGINQNNLSVARWTKATFFGWFAGIIFMLGLSGFLDSIGIEKFQFYIGGGLGAGVGVFQWWSLKKSVGITHQWVWSSLFGMGIPFLIFDLVSQYGNPLGSYYLPLSVASGATLTSVLQFFILKKYSSKAGRWIFGCIVGWMLAAATVLSIDYIKFVIDHNWTLFFINVAMILGGGVVLGVVTGRILISLFKNT